MIVFILDKNKQEHGKNFTFTTFNLAPPMVNSSTISWYKLTNTASPKARYLVL